MPKILLKRSSQAGYGFDSTLSAGELALNYKDKKLYFKDADGNITNVIAGCATSGEITSAVNSAVSGLASETYVNNAVTTGTSGLASETYVNNAVTTGTSGLASTTYVSGNYVAKTGDVGTFTAYETVGTSGTITEGSPSANEVSGSVSVANGTSGKSWTKIVRLTGSSPTATIGSSWHWVNGETPELSMNGILVLCWCGSGGLATFQSAS